MEIVYTETFETWLKELRDQTAKGAILARLKRIRGGNFSDRRGVGRGISELRINVGKGYRVYYTIRQQTLVILLCGGDKTSQQQDIRRAQRMASQL